jgi:DNA-binding Lrp family transcriptional regulator
MISTGNEIVDKMQMFNASGNIVPPQWYKTVVRANGKPNLNAIIILSDLVYWYKPRNVRDESTGHIVKAEKRFKSDLLQRSYQQLADQFGISKREATNAVVELEKMGVLKRHLRNIKVNGMTITNVLFLELIAEKVFELTFGSQVAVSQSDTSHFKKVDPLTLESDTSNFKKVDPLTPESDTYTEITTEITTKNTNNNNIVLFEGSAKKEQKKVSTSGKVDNKEMYEQFELLWSLYPKGRKQGKETAKKAFVKAIKDGVAYETIEKALRAFGDQMKREKRETRYIKTGGVWFNQKCWEDEYDTEEPNQKEYEGYNTGGLFV